jgi:dienelactone hydrolase
MRCKKLNMTKLKKIFIQISFFYSLLFSNGPFSIETITQQDGLRDGPDYSEALVYYPLNAPIHLPVVVLVPGFTNSISDIENWGYYLASYGFVTFLVNVNSIWEPPSYRAAALLDGIVTMKLEDERLNSPLFGSLNIADFTVGGYSMGGGGAQLAAQQDSSIKAVIALSPWLESPDASLNNSTSILFISGEFDTVAPNDYHTNVFYNNTPETTDKLLYEISGGDHYTVVSPYSDQEMGLKTVFWLEKYILNDLSNCDSLIIQPSTASDFSTNIECPSNIVGDITQDGSINFLDLVLLISWIINGNIPSDLEIFLADMTNDGVLDIFDILILTDII